METLKLPHHIFPELQAGRTTLAVYNLPGLYSRSYNNLGVWVLDDDRDHNLWPKRLFQQKENMYSYSVFFCSSFCILKSPQHLIVLYMYLCIYKDHLKFIWNISVDAPQSPSFLNCSCSQVLESSLTQCGSTRAKPQWLPDWCRCEERWPLAVNIHQISHPPKC